MIDGTEQVVDHVDRAQRGALPRTGAGALFVVAGADVLVEAVDVEREEDPQDQEAEAEPAQGPSQTGATAPHRRRV